MIHMMIDLETLDTKPSAVVLSVGAVVFNTEKIIRHGYWVIDPREQIANSRTMSFDTIKWWMEQNKEAQKVFTDQAIGLHQFAGEFENLFMKESMHLWGNGSDFDLSIMMDLWSRHSLPRIKGWKYSNHMCFRTFNQMHNVKQLVERKGTYHNALDDAIYQAECVIASGKLK